MTNIEETKKKLVEEFERRGGTEDLLGDYDDEGQPQDSLMREERWPETKYELDPDKVKDFLTTALQSVEEATREECMREIEDAQSEHNDARHGTTPDNAYDRAYDAINPKLKNLWDSPTESDKSTDANMDAIEKELGYD